MHFEENYDAFMYSYATKILRYAIARHPTLTTGLSLSPILAIFHRVNLMVPNSILLPSSNAS
jgi:hypothetical protein